MISRIALVLALLLAGQARAAISVSWGDSYDGFDNTANTTNNAVDATGYTHVVAYGCTDATTAVITFTDSVSSTGWTYLTQTTQGTSITCRMGYATLASAGSGYTVTAVHTVNGTFRNHGFWLLDSDSGLVALDASALASAASGNPADAGTLSTTGASVVSVMAIGIGGASTGNTEGSGWTENMDNNENFGSRNIAASRGPETTTPIDPSYTLNNAAIPWVALAASFRETAPPSAAVLLLMQQQ